MFDFLNFGKDKNDIILKDGYNKKAIISIVVIIIIVVGLAVTSMMLPDSRRKMTSNTESTLLFTFARVDVEKNFSIDKEQDIAQIYLKETKQNVKDKYAISYKVYDDSGREMETNIVYSSNLNKSEDIAEEKELLLQFSVPSEFYYIRIVVIQKDNTSQEIILDYRDFKKESLSEKGKDYLVRLHEAKDLLNDYETELEEKSETLKTSEEYIEKYKKLSADEQKKQETTKKNHDKNIDELPTEIEKLNTLIEAQRTLISQME